MSQLLRIADRVVNRPLLLLPEKLAIITDVLSGRLAIDTPPAGLAARDPAEAAEIEAALDRATPGASRFVGGSADADGRLPYRRTADGVAIVTITGSLVNRGAWVGASSGLTSYEGIAFQIETAARDPKVKSIVLDIESPGGEAVGCFEVAATIRKVGAEKPVHCVVNGMACSAAYAIASACRSITSVESGLSGSIGVVMLHQDWSRALDKAGVTTTFIHAGAHKVDGNPFEPLPESVRADLQAEVDNFYSLFVDTVAAGRKGLSKKAIRETEARTFIGQAAKDAGLIDQIGTFGDLVGELSKSAVRSKSMSETERASVRQVERSRISTILYSPEGQSSPAAARKLAFETDLPSAEAIEQLKATGPTGGFSRKALFARASGGAGEQTQPATPASAKSSDDDRRSIFARAQAGG